MTGGAPFPATFRPRERLSSPAEFRGVLRRGIRLEGRFFVLLALDNGRPFNRLGITASRKVGSAVERNRAKRLVREAFRRSRFAASFDLVLILKGEIVGRRQVEVLGEYRERVRRLELRRGRRPRPRPPPPR